MKKILLKNLHIENFKGIRDLDVVFSGETLISGRNASGKTTISDSFSWLLFDKDSAGNSTFAIRPKDANGRDIDNLEIKVEAALDIDGEEVTLTKIQKQKWTKHRGSTAPTFEGNVNEFQVNGFPAKKSEYEAQIHSMIDESLFRLITNPRTFAAMKWQDQRKTLMEFVSDVTDESILETDSEKYEPIREDVLAAGSDKAREKASAALKTLKKEQLEYPVRIDETMRQVRTDLPELSVLMKQKRQAEDELHTVQNERNSLSTASNAAADIQNQIMQKRRRMAEIERSAMLEDEKKNLAATKAANDALMEVRKAENERDALANKRAFLMAAIKENKEAKTALKDQFMAVKKEQFPESETICPTCGRPFETGRITSIKADWEQKNKDRIEALNKKGFALKDKIAADEELLETIEQRISGYTADIDGMNAKWEELVKIANFPIKTDVKTIPEYQELQAGCDELDRKLASMDDTSSVKRELSERENSIRSTLDGINANLTAINVQAGFMKRVEELKAAQMDCGQKVADQEQIVWLLDEFMKAKMDLLSERINSHFKKVRFRLFTDQINGGVKETCTMQINTNGSYVDYSDANNAAKIIGGLDVIEALSGLYEVEAPIMLDNSECLDRYNTPEMDAQLILLEVSDDETLHVERM